jgi:hypothetical protein
MRELLLAHYQRYPLMRIQDMVKLIFQNEFAGGHMLTDEAMSLSRLTEEFRTIRRNSSAYSNQPLFEEIGNGLVRLYLQGLGSDAPDLSTINRFFMVTSNTHKGSIEGFEKKLDELMCACRSQTLPYTLKALEDYLQQYRSQGYPAVSHSEQYRTAYSPAYRVIRREFAVYLDVFARIDQLLGCNETVIIAIDGKSGAGKSTLASLLASVYDLNLFHMDDFFLRPELKTPERLGEIGGNVDYERFYQEVLKPLARGEAFRYQVYDCKTQALGDWREAPRKRINIIEGSYSMHPLLRDAYDLKVFLNISDEEQSSRILSRNGPFMHKRFINEWIPLENAYFEGMRIKEQCDLVYDYSQS